MAKIVRYTRVELEQAQEEIELLLSWFPDDFSLNAELKRIQFLLGGSDSADGIT